MCAQPNLNKDNVEISLNLNIWDAKQAEQSRIYDRVYNIDNEWSKQVDW